MTKFDPKEWQGTICGEYRLSMLLGQGRAGGVFIAETVTAHELAALKIYSPGRYAEAAQAIARERESLHHPSIVPQLASGSIRDGYFYTVQEYAAYKQVGGRNDRDCLNLEEYLNQSPGFLEEDVIADLLTQLTDALTYAHSAADLPYGVQHAPQAGRRPESFRSLLARALPCWQKALLPGGVAAVSFNTLTFPAQQVIDIAREAGWTLLEDACLTHLRHEVEQAVVRDVVFIMNTPFEGGT